MLTPYLAAFAVACKIIEERYSNSMTQGTEPIEYHNVTCPMLTPEGFLDVAVFHDIGQVQASNIWRVNYDTGEPKVIQ